MIHGRELKIYKNGEAIACSTSCNYEANAEVIEVASATSANAKEYIVGKQSWTVENSSLFATTSNFNLATGDEVDLRFRSNTTEYGGRARCTSCKLVATIGNLCKYTATFVGDGIINDYTVGYYLYTSENLIVETSDGQNILMS